MILPTSKLLTACTRIVIIFLKRSLSGSVSKYKKSVIQSFQLMYSHFLFSQTFYRCFHRRIRIVSPERDSLVKCSKKSRQSTSRVEDICRTVHGSRSSKCRTTDGSSTTARLLRSPREGRGDQVRRHAGREQGQPRKNGLHLQQAQLLHPHPENGIRCRKRSKAF